MTSDSLMAPTPPWMTRTFTSSLESFSREAFTASTLPWTSALTIRASSLRSPAWIWSNRFSRETFCTGAAALAFSSAFRCSTSSRAMRSSATAKKGLPALGGLGQARDLHRHGGAGLGEAGALVVHHGADAAHGGAGDDDVALLQRAVLDQQGGHGAPALVQPGLDDSALGGPVGVGLQLRHLGGEGHHLQQVLDADVLLGGDLAADGVAAPLLGHQAVLGQLLDAPGPGLAFSLVDLVDGHDDGDIGGLGVVDGLHGLGHDAVVRRHHQDGDVRDHGAPGPHGGKRLVARGIQEGDGLAVHLHLIGADVLGDAAGLAGRHGGVADGSPAGRSCRGPRGP